MFYSAFIHYQTPLQTFLHIAGRPIFQPGVARIPGVIRRLEHVFIIYFANIRLSPAGVAGHMKMPYYVNILCDILYEVAFAYLLVVYIEQHLYLRAVDFPYDIESL